MINGRLLLSGSPLRRVSVEVGSEGKYVTDDNGMVWMPKHSGSIRAKVWAATPACRVLNGAKFNIAYTQDVTIPASGDVFVPNEGNAFAVSQVFLDAFESIKQAFPGWTDFPNLSDESDFRVEVAWPDRFPIGSLSFTEPYSQALRMPLIHLKQNQFQVQVAKEEMGHAIHFAYLSPQERKDIQDMYMDWLVNSPQKFHRFDLATNEFVAWIETWGVFCAYNFVSPLPRFVYPGDGRVCEGALINLLFVDLAPLVSKIDGWKIVGPTIVQSHAKTFNEYARWVAKSRPTWYPNLQRCAQKYHISI